MNLLDVMMPEVILGIAASALFLLGMSMRVVSRKTAPVLALMTLVAVFFMQVNKQLGNSTETDSFGTIRVFEFAGYIKMLTAGVGVLLVLLAWPSSADGTGNSAMHLGTEVSEFFALMLLSIAGIFLVAGANDMILLFLGIELASIPTYIMVSISRPLPVAQEAGVKYFFLGAMSAAVMLFGFSYLYGATGSINLLEITEKFHATMEGRAIGATTLLTPWQMLAVVMLMAGFAFKLAAAPLHFYAPDVYQGAATPVTAFLSFVPKTAGMVAMIKLLYIVGGGSWNVPESIAKLLWVLAVLTMTIGNVLGLLQLNVKRVLACSSIAHSGYMLVGLATLAYSKGEPSAIEPALQGVLFYLAAYGIMNAGAFGVLMLLPARSGAPATSAETFDDIAGTGRRHVVLGLAMATACFSLVGLPLTVGFFGKLYLIRPALSGGLYWLVVLMMVNAAISAGYYLKIVSAMFLRSDRKPGETAEPVAIPAHRSMPVTLAIALSIAGTILFGSVLPATEMLNNRVTTATQLERSAPTRVLGSTGSLSR